VAQEAFIFLGHDIENTPANRHACRPYSSGHSRHDALNAFARIENAVRRSRFLSNTKHFDSEGRREPPLVVSGRCRHQLLPLYTHTIMANMHAGPVLMFAFSWSTHLNHA